jgi:predicted O-linked N-acetylglucosamine transferase (SPINDLY family)
MLRHSTIPKQKFVTSNKLQTLLEQGINKHKLGKINEAEKLYQQVIKNAPGHFDALQLLGSIEVIKKNYAGSITYLKRAIKTNPFDAKCHNFLGVVLEENGQHDEALISYQNAVLNNSSYAEAYFNMGNVLQKLKLFDEAVESYSKVTAIEPGHSNAYFNCGNALGMIGRYDEAITSHAKAIEIDPKYKEAFTNIGSILQKQGNFTASEEYYLKAIEIDPAFIEAHYNLGNLFKEQKQFEKALISYDQVLKIKPDFGLAYNNVGTILQDLGDLDNAAAYYVKAIETSPSSNADVYNNLGVLLKSQKNLDAALSYFEKAITIKSDYAEAYNNMGATLEAQGDIEKALSSYDLALKIQPDFVGAIVNKGAILNKIGLPDLALIDYEMAFALDPTFNYLLGTIINTKQELSDWNNWETYFIALKNGIQQGQKVSPPFTTFLLIDNPDIQHKAAILFAQDRYVERKKLAPISRKSPEKKIKLGYFSSDFYHHPVSDAIIEQIKNHDRTKFELFAFSFKHQNDFMQANLKKAFDHFIEVDKIDDAGVVKLACSHGIDIAFDLCGHTSEPRPGLFSMRVAPIQVNYIGYPGSIGSKCIDYFIADKNLTPKENQPFFTEKIAYVPYFHTYNSQRQISTKTISRAQFGLPDEGFIFTCQNVNRKITPEVFNIWMEILRAIPESVLWLCETNSVATNNLKKEAQARGVDSNRLIFTKRESVPPNQENDRIGRYLAMYSLADLYLDTWPYTSSTTAMDSLYAGLPILTKQGSSTVSRMGSTALSHFKLNELIANSTQEYFNIAIDLATNPKKLNAIKNKLAKNKSLAPMLNSINIVCNLEKIYTTMYERYHSGLLPDHIDLEIKSSN